MKCPRCGADNSERAETCYLCDYAFGSGAGADEPPSADGAARARYQAPGAPAGAAAAREQAVPTPPPGAHAGGYQPPPTAPYPGGYQPPPPGAYAAGYQPPVPATRGSNTAKIAIVVLVIVLVALVGAAAFFFLRGKDYAIEVPVPPGYVQADRETLEEAEKSLQSEDTDMEIDHLFVKPDYSSFVFVLHQKFFLSELPPDDPEEAEKYYLQHKDEITGDMDLAGMGQVGAYGGLDFTDYETQRMGTGDTALHMGMEMTAQGISMDLDMLLVVKEKTMFLLMIEGIGDSGTDETLDFLRENVTFRQ